MRLIELGGCDGQLRWSYQFWKAYKEEKGADTSQTYEEHIMEEQEEWRRERGYVEGQKVNTCVQ